MQSKSGLRGNLDLTNVADLLQFLEASGKNGALGLSRGLGGKKARIYFTAGQIAHAASGELMGLSALAEVLDWSSGEFNFAPGVEPPRVTLEMPLQHALMEAARIRDETRRAYESLLVRDSEPVKDDGSNGRSTEEIDFNFDDEESFGNLCAQQKSNGLETEPQNDIDRDKEESQPESERKVEMAYNQERSSTEVLEDMLKVPGVDAVVVVGRDGFVIESVGSSARLNIDALGAALAHAINGIEEMGAELRVDNFSDLFVEYARSVLLCRPVGEAIAVCVTPDASKLGIIRHKAKALYQELNGLF